MWQHYPELHGLTKKHSITHLPWTRKPARLSWVLLSVSLGTLGMHSTEAGSELSWGLWWDSFGLKTRLPLCLLLSLSETPHGPLQIATHSREACSPESGTWERDRQRQRFERENTGQSGQVVSRWLLKVTLDHSVTSYDIWLMQSTCKGGDSSKTYPPGDGDCGEVEGRSGRPLGVHALPRVTDWSEYTAGCEPSSVSS